MVAADAETAKAMRAETFILIILAFRKTAAVVAIACLGGDLW
jgi:hypothetical protein